jgi:O-antigen/teichoic acid export membrane protein
LNFCHLKVSRFPKLNRLLFFETIWIIISYIISILGSILLVKLLTKYLSTNEYGELTLALTIGTLVCQVAFAISMPGISRFYTLSVEKTDIFSFLQAAKETLLKSTILSFCFGVIAIIALFFLHRNVLVIATILAIFYSILSSYNSTLSLIQNAARKRKVVSIVSALDAISKLLILLLFLNAFMATSEVVIVCYLLVVLLVLVSQFYFIRNLLVDVPKDILYKQMWVDKIYKFSKPFLIFNLFTWFQSNSDRWALELFTTTSNVGLYSVLFQLGYTPITILSGFVSTLLSPIIYAKAGSADDDSRNHKVKKITWMVIALIFVLGLITFLVSFFFHNFIFELLVSSQFRTFSFLMPWMVLAATIASASHFLSIKIMGDLETHKMILPKVSSSIICVIMTFWGAKTSGLNGVIFSLISFNIVQFIWLAVVSNKKVISA